ncbi:MAG: hypothetical protein PHR16_14105 [Methylovulum sp.]|nr:hypothetical protein [Methylovulum sp.]
MAKLTFKGVYTPSPLLRFNWAPNPRLVFKGDYKPSGTLNFSPVPAPPPAPVLNYTLSAVTDDCTANVDVIGSAPAIIDATADDAVGLISIPYITNASLVYQCDDVVAVMQVAVVYTAAIDAVLDAAVAVVGAGYDSAVWRGVSRTSQAAHQNSLRKFAQIASNHAQGIKINPTLAVIFKAAVATPNAVFLPWLQVHLLPVKRGIVWAGADVADGRDVGVAYFQPASKTLVLQPDWAGGDDKSAGLTGSWYYPPAKPKVITVIDDTSVKLIKYVRINNKQSSRHLRDQRAIVWGEAERHNWIVGPVVIPPIINPPTVWPPTLIFRCKKPYYINGKNTTIIFTVGCPWQSLFIPKKRVYIVLNEVLIQRLPELTALDCTDLSISGDVDNWTWSFNATLASARQLDLIKPVDALNPREVRITINGQAWDFIVEGWGRSRTFPKSGVTISGRSTSAYLADPYAIISSTNNAADIGAQQLADWAVQYTDWTIDWQLSPDWLVLATAFNYRGTPLGQLLKLAEAAGGVVQTAPHLKQISLLKRYPVLPWDWATATPYAQIPEDIMLGLGSTYSVKPSYNAVYVSGESVGVTAQVTRDGTAGELVAPMVVNPLVTDVYAARSLGERILADTGAQELFKFEMPVEPIVGVVPLNVLLEIDEAAVLRRGLSRSIQINASWSNGLVVRQQIEVEYSG